MTNKLGNPKYYTTKKLKEIIDEPYHRGSNGIDYGPIIEDIKSEYWERLSKNDEPNKDELESYNREE